MTVPSNGRKGLDASVAPAGFGMPIAMVHQETRPLSGENGSGVHPMREGYAMTTRRTAFVLIAVAVSIAALTPVHGAVPPDDAGLDPLPVRGVVLPGGDFVGTLRIVACTRDAAGQLRLTGVLTATVAHRTRGRIPVTQQPFTAPATLRDPGHTTDVVGLALAPITLDPIGVQIRLLPILVDIETLPQLGDELARLLPVP
jgi:hypothetical protein